MPWNPKVRNEKIQEWRKTSKAWKRWQKKYATKARKNASRYYWENRSYVLKRMRDDRRHRPRVHKGYNLQKSFGISIDEYDALLKRQHGRCAICRHSPSGVALAVDHNHKTDVVRGLLCATCNGGVGMFKDSAALLKRATDYLRKGGY